MDVHRRIPSCRACPRGWKRGCSHAVDASAITQPASAGASRASSGWRWARDLLHDRLLLGIVVACALLLSFQLALFLRHPPGNGPVTDWLRAALAWPELAIVVAVSLWLSRRHRPEALSWWLFSGGTLCYAIARTWWTLDDAVIYHHGVPFPTFPDLLFVLQYPFYFLAVLLFPLDGVWGSRLLAILDALLWMGAATAVVWYFLLAPLYMATRFSPLAKAVSLGYPVADLFLLLALVLILLRALRHGEDRPVVGLVVASFACLIVADAGAAFLILHPAHEYRTGQLPDFFWLAADLLIPLAALVQVRVVQRVASAGRRRSPRARIARACTDSTRRTSGRLSASSCRSSPRCWRAWRSSSAPPRMPQWAPCGRTLSSRCW